MGLFDGMFGGNTSTSSTGDSTTTTKPWAPLGDKLEQGYAYMGDLLSDEQGFAAYKGPQQASLSPYTQESQNLVANMARAPSMFEGGINNVAHYASGGEMAGGMPDYLRSMLDYNANLIGGQTAGGASAAGRYGSRSHANTTAQGIAAANNPFIFNFANNAANRSLQAGAMMPMMNEMRYDGATRLAGLGDFDMQREQQRLDQAKADWTQNQQADWNRVSAYTAALGGMPSVGGSSYSTGTKPTTSGLQGMLGGAMSGALMGAQFGSMVPGVGTGMGALGGAIGGGILGGW